MDNFKFDGENKADPRIQSSELYQGARHAEKLVAAGLAKVNEEKDAAGVVTHIRVVDNSGNTILYFNKEEAELSGLFLFKDSEIS